MKTALGPQVSLWSWKMKQLAILFAVICTIGILSNEAQAQHYRHGGWGNHYGNHFHHVHRPVNRSGFAISIGNGRNGFSYSNFRGGTSFGVGFGAPVYRAPIYGYGRGFGPYYGGGFYGGGWGGYGCRGW